MKFKQSLFYFKIFFFSSVKHNRINVPFAFWCMFKMMWSKDLCTGTSTFWNKLFFWRKTFFSHLFFSFWFSLKIMAATFHTLWFFETFHFYSSFWIPFFTVAIDLIVQHIREFVVNRKQDQMRNEGHATPSPATSPVHGARRPNTPDMYFKRPH